MGCCASKKARIYLGNNGRPFNEAKKGNMERLKATMDQQNAQNRTTLHIACALNNTTIVAFLLDNGANAMLRDVLSYTCLHEAALNCSYECMELLLDRGCIPVDDLAMLRMTPLHVLVCGVNRVSRPNDLRAECIKLLRKHGADPRGKTFKVCTKGNPPVSSLYSAQGYGQVFLQGENRQLLTAAADCSYICKTSCRGSDSN